MYIHYCVGHNNLCGSLSLAAVDIESTESTCPRCINIRRHSYPRSGDKAFYWHDNMATPCTIDYVKEGNYIVVNIGSNCYKMFTWEFWDTDNFGPLE